MVWVTWLMLLAVVYLRYTGTFADTWPAPGASASPSPGSAPSPAPALDPSNPIHWHAGAIAGAVVSTAFIGAFVGLFAFGFRRGYFNPRVKLVRVDHAPASAARVDHLASAAGRGTGSDKARANSDGSDSPSPSNGAGNAHTPVDVINDYRAAVIANAIANQSGVESDH